MSQERKVWSCALSGHRKLPPQFNKNALYDKLEEIALKGCETFYCGMAQGFDLAALECLVALKRKYRINIEACIPYAGHESGFPYSEKRKFYELLEWCDKKTVLFPSYRDGCFLDRNRYMVDNADLLLVYCLRNTGGTAFTANYGLKKGIPVIFLS